MPLEHVIGQKARAIREREGLTQDELAAEVPRQGLNWSRSAIAGLEGGDKSTQSCRSRRARDGPAPVPNRA